MAVKPGKAPVPTRSDDDLTFVFDFILKPVDDGR